MNDAVKDLYQKVIVDHGKSPRNHGALPHATHEATARNPLCGDEVTVRATVRGGFLDEVRFESRGCILSRASASLMTERVTGQSPDAAQAIGRELEAFVSSPPEAGAAERLADLAVFEGVRDYPSRVACVTLPWQALAQLLSFPPT